MNVHEPASPDRRRFVSTAAGLATLAAAGSAFTGTADSPVPPKRQNINTMEATKLEKLEGAIGEMMDRSKTSPTDPKGWLANAEPHNAFCAVPATSGAAQIHFCYWFLPWHRAFLAITERKIREIASDSTLCLPYWNWTTTRRIPERFAKPSSPLSRAVRFTASRDLDASEIDYIEADGDLRALGVAALSASRFVAAATTDTQQFRLNLINSFGGVARPNAAMVYGNGRLEGTPHGPVHGYVGGRHPATLRGGDMSNFETAARDPIFFAHHGNLDRLWELWRSTGTNLAQEPTSTAFLKHRFFFPWLDGTAVEISVADTLDTAKLGYSYDTLQVIEPSSTPSFQPESASTPKALPPIGRSKVQVPLTPESANAAAGGRYYLQIEGIEAPNRILNAAVYVHKADAPDPKLLVGAISVVQSGSQYHLVNVPVFDVTAAVRTLQSANLEVVIIPNALGGEARDPYRPLRYAHMSIIRQ